MDTDSVLTDVAITGVITAGTVSGEPGPVQRVAVFYIKLPGHLLSALWCSPPTTPQLPPSSAAPSPPSMATSATTWLALATVVPLETYHDSQAYRCQDELALTE